MKRKVVAAIVLGSFLASAPAAFAAGYSILEQSSEGLGVGFAGATAGYGDGSEVFFNPSAMSSISSTTVSAGLAGIFPKAKFKNEGSTLASAPIPLAGSNDTNDKAAVVPSLYAVHPMGDWTVGFGVNAPFGLETKYSNDWVGRYHATRSELVTINMSPAVSYKMYQFDSGEALSVGASANIYYLDATLENAIDFGTIGFGVLGAPTASRLGLTPQRADGYGKVNGDDWAMGWTLGATYTYEKRSRVGVAWRSHVAAALKGDAEFTVPASARVLQSSGLFTDTDVRAGVTLPESISVGWLHQVNDKWSLLSDVQWTRWSRFSELRIEYDSIQPDTVVDENWKNAIRWSFGSKYKLSDAIELSAGVTWDESPVRGAEYRTPRIPDSDRFWLATGLGYSFSDSLKADISYAHIFVKDATTNVVSPTAGRLSGSWDSSIDLVSIGLTKTF